MPPEIDLTSTMGALLIGILFSVCLFGMTTLQTWYYYQHYPQDIIGLKVMVAILWIFELLHAILGCHAIYFFLILNFTNTEGLDTSIWSADLTLLATAIITLIVHMFFARRVWILSCGSLAMPIIIMIGAIINSAFTCATVAISFEAGKFSKYPHSINVTSSIALAFAVATDIAIAGSLGYYLHRGRSGLTRTDNIINKLIFWAVNIGILTSSVDLVVLATSRIQSSLIFLAVFEVVGNLYANSLLATLNLRAYTRGQVLNEDGTTVDISFNSEGIYPLKGPLENITMYRNEGTLVTGSGQENHSTHSNPDNDVQHFVNSEQVI